MREVKTMRQTLDSREVAEMIGKAHSELLKDIRRYIGQFMAGHISHHEFFLESSYTDTRGAARPCFQLTKKGCEFIAHKLTGTRGTVFTMRYINCFYEMQERLANPAKEADLPWFIRKFQGGYIVLERDFIAITGVNIKKHRLFYHPAFFRSGLDFNGWGWKCDNEIFRRKYGFDYGSDPCMTYFYPRGVLKALAILAGDSQWAISEGADRIFMEGLKKIPSLRDTPPPSQGLALLEIAENSTESKVLWDPFEVSLM